MTVHKIKFIQENGETFEVTAGESFNEGKYNCNIINQSIAKLGLARSIVVDRDHNVICGNKVLTCAASRGIRKVRVIETSGDELVVVKRIDVEADSRISHEISLVDNLSATKNIKYNADLILATMNRVVSFDARQWNGHECLVRELDIQTLIKDNVIAQTQSKKKIKQEEVQHQVTLFG